MSVEGVNALNTNAESVVQAEKRKDQLGEDAFLKLFIAQLKNQDPMNPMDSTEFTAQLAQFSSLEQLTDINKNLGSLQNYQSASNNSQAVSFIGKDIKAKGDSFYFNGDNAADIALKLDSYASDVKVYIYDDKDHLVKIIEKPDFEAGMHNVSWDGTGDNGETMPSGNYSFDVMATDMNGNSVNSSTYVSGTVTGITYSNNSVYLMLGKQQIAPSDVIEVSGR